MRARIKDVRQGRTLWFVSCYLLDPRNRKTAHVSRVECLDTPKLSKNVIHGKRTLFANFRMPSGLWPGTYDTRHSLCDQNIVWNDYNQHMAFTKQKAAEAYAARIRRGCYNAQELAFMRKCDRMTRRMI